MRRAASLSGSTRGMVARFPAVQVGKTRRRGRFGARPARLVHVSSEAGSLGRFRASKKPEYAMSKAALNALTRWVAAVEPSLVCASLDPGWTATRTGGDGATFTPEQTAARLVVAIDRLGPEHSGGFYDAELVAIPW